MNGVVYNYATLAINLMSSSNNLVQTSLGVPIPAVCIPSPYSFVLSVPAGTYVYLIYL